MALLSLLAFFWLPAFLLHNFGEASFRKTSLLDELSANTDKFGRRHKRASGKFWDWKTGKEIGPNSREHSPVVFDENGEIKIIGSMINGTMPDPIKLYFDEGPTGGRREMTMKMCVWRNCEPENTCKLTVCYIGRMDPRANKSEGIIRSLWHLPNRLNNDIGKKCRNAQPLWRSEFRDEVLHGFELEYFNYNKTLKVSTSYHWISNYYTFDENVDYKCINVIMGEKNYFDGYVESERNLSNWSIDRIKYGSLLLLENCITGLAYDMLFGIHQGDAIGIIGEGGKSTTITLMGDGLRKCKGKKCEDSLPK